MVFDDTRPRVYLVRVGTHHLGHVPGQVLGIPGGREHTATPQISFVEKCSRAHPMFDVDKLMIGSFMISLHNPRCFGSDVAGGYTPDELVEHIYPRRLSFD